MAEVIALGASIIAIVQIADRVIGLCRSYLGTVHDAPSDLRAMLIETSTMKAILENLELLVSCNNEQSSVLDSLDGPNGALHGCQNAMTKMEGLFPPDYSQGLDEHRSKRQKLKACWDSLAWPSKAERAKKLVEDLGRFKMTISLALTADNTHDIKEMKAQTHKIHEKLTDSERYKVYEWLQVTDPTPLHNRACKQYEPETGNWMLRSTEWENWIEGRIRCIWIYGIPGAGKTILLSHLIENLKKHCEKTIIKKSACVYYYCYFGHNQEEAGPFLRWILNQLCREAKLVLQRLNKLYERGGEPSLVELLGALEEILQSFDIVYVFIDAIDESMQRDDLLKVLRDLATDPRFKKLQLLATSRQYLDIERVMEPFSAPLSMMNHLLDEDIKFYVKSKLDTNPRFKNWPQTLLDEVLEALSTKAMGMFRWVVCQIQEIERIKPESGVLKRTLANLPRTLDESYERVLLGVSEDERLVVHHVLKWIYYHQEIYPFDIPCDILIQAVKLSTRDLTPFAHDHLLDEELIRDICGCLIRIMSEPHHGQGDDDKIRYVSFAHYTVWEFLNSTRILNTRAAQFVMVPTATKMELTRVVIREIILLATQINCMIISESGIEHHPYIPQSYTSTGSFLRICFACFCPQTLLHMVSELGPDLAIREDLRKLVFNLFDPTKAHFSCFKIAAPAQSYCVGFADLGVGSGLEEIMWNSLPKNNDAAILTHLLLVDRSCELARKFIEKIQIKEVLETQLDIRGIADLNEDPLAINECNFRGTILEIFTILSYRFLRACKFLLELGLCYLDHSWLVISVVGSHRCMRHYVCDCKITLSELLQRTAVVNSGKFIATPLQIAVAREDNEAVGELLRVGADPNGTGNSGGEMWEEGTYLSRFNNLCGLSPLEILQRKNKHSDIDESTIHKMLVKYGARLLPYNDSDYVRITNEEDLWRGGLGGFMI